MAKPIATILSYGMGVESSAILLRWIMSPVTRPCSLEDLIVITSQVGDEYTDTGRDVEAHMRSDITPMKPSGSPRASTHSASA